MLTYNKYHTYHYSINVITIFITKKAIHFKRFIICIRIQNIIPLIILYLVYFNVCVCIFQRASIYCMSFSNSSIFYITRHKRLWIKFYSKFWHKLQVVDVNSCKKRNWIKVIFTSLVAQRAFTNCRDTRTCQDYIRYVMYVNYINHLGFTYSWIYIVSQRLYERRVGLSREMT